MAHGQANSRPHVATLCDESESHGIARADCESAMRHLVSLCWRLLKRYHTGELSTEMIRTVAKASAGFALWCIGAYEQARILPDGEPPSASGARVCEPRGLTYEARAVSFVPPILHNGRPTSGARRSAPRSAAEGVLHYLLGTTQTMAALMPSLPIEAMDWNSFREVLTNTASKLRKLERCLKLRKLERCLSSQAETVAPPVVTPTGSFDQNDSSGAKMLEPLERRLLSGTVQAGVPPAPAPAVSPSDTRSRRGSLSPNGKELTALTTAEGKGKAEEENTAEDRGLDLEIKALERRLQQAKAERLQRAKAEKAARLDWTMIDWSGLSENLRPIPRDEENDSLCSVSTSDVGEWLRNTIIEEEELPINTGVAHTDKGSNMNDPTTRKFINQYW
jgi:hypothetical protein